MGHLEEHVLEWLRTGDVALAYQVHRDLLSTERADLRERISNEGVGAALLAARGPQGHWGDGFYQPKWTCTHYTLLELMGLGLAPEHPVATQVVADTLGSLKGPDGGVNPSGTIKASDVCINGMVLSYASYFGADEPSLRSVLDFVLAQRMADGGFNCRSNRSGALVSSVHTSVSVLEGLTAYRQAGHRYRADEVSATIAATVEYFLEHHLYRRISTGEVMRAEFLRLHHPTRWYFDVLRGLDALRGAGVPPDPRMADALTVLRSRRRPDGRWAANRGYAGHTHVPEPRAGTPNRWITLTALRVLAVYPKAA